jgi:hypothetical protein
MAVIIITNTHRVMALYVPKILLFSLFLSQKQALWKGCGSVPRILN